MHILILTPDTDIDRRIILQANELLKLGVRITILGAPFDKDNYLSGQIDERIEIKRIATKDITYFESMVQWYFKTHKKLDAQYACVGQYAKDMRKKHSVWPGGLFLRIRNKIIRMALFVGVKGLQCYYYLGKYIVNIVYCIFLVWVKFRKKNFFPNFDNGFYNIGKDIKADCIVANDLPALHAAYKLAREKNIPFVYDAHENYTEQCTLPKWLVRKFEKIENEILPHAKFWIVPNEFLGKAVREKYKRLFHTEIQEPVVIQNAVSYIPEPAPQKIIHAALGLSAEQRIILFQGGYLPKRNLENMIKSMLYVKTSTAIMVLLGFGNYAEILKGLVRKYSLEEKVHFLEAVPQTELLKYTCSADIGVIPYGAVDKNTYYCSPNKLYEYIQGRLPILSNDLPFLRKMVIENNMGQVVDFSNPQEIAVALDKLLSSKMELERYRLGLKEAAEKFSWEKEAVKLLKKYQEEILNNDVNIRVKEGLL